ncbi:MAG: excinuclease ABC subunit UvrA [Candidatus Marinimicrobia bacterium]|nr:excinuclease ABC subunit UvrA [Candidatus Neomarinimicrobiota bacterium]
MESNTIKIKGAREHNLKNINVEIPRNQLVVITGVSGSGKSSLAFDTIYAEGQRRYVESLSSYARQFLGLMEKPDVDFIEGLSPAISIEQKSTSRNPRSTVGTVTEIYDYLRLLYARIGKPFCYKCGRPIISQTVQEIADSILKFPENSKLVLMAPLVRGRKGEYKNIYDEIRKEGFLRLRIDGEITDVDSPVELDKNKKHNIEVVIDRLVIRESIFTRLTESVELALKIGSGLIIAKIGNEEHFFSENYSCPHCEISFEELTPRMFSFNSPFGACLDCDGLGSKLEMDESLIIPDGSKSLAQGAILPLGPQPRGKWYASILKGLAKEYQFDFHTPYEKLSDKAQKALLYGTEKSFSVNYSSDKMQGKYTTRFEGVMNNLKRRYTQTTSPGIRKWIERFMSQKPCMTCNGERLRPESRSVKINDIAIGELTSYSISDALEFFMTLSLSQTEKQIAKQILKEIKERLHFLVNVGVEYLTLNRSAQTLSGGEAQRIRLATQIGSQLTGVLYILDEPSIGLHQRDNTRLIQTLTKLRNLGNTVIVVEHDQETIEAADHVLDIGPAAGIDGGRVIAQGSPKEIANNPESLTGQYLSGKKFIPLPTSHRKGNGKKIKLTGAAGNNLKDIDVVIPLGKFVCITGVSGSGKSSLVNETLYPILHNKLNHTIKTTLKYKTISGIEYIDKVIDIDQSPIGRTPRSNPATYTGVFDFIRELFASTKDAKIRGYKAGRFSFNVKGGRCENCGGEGIKKIEMHFLPDVYVPCEVCKGHRYNRETLEIKFKGKSISDILEMTVQQATDFFDKLPKIREKLETLQKVGLGYIQLGQQATTLSGGEAQRIKLATELSKKNTGNTLYILDEPTTGLHFEDIKLLLSVLNDLADKGNTILVIEHNLDIIKSADHIIDLGPEGGNRGGQVLVTGTPEHVAKTANSYTGQYLKKIFH